jgi:hypothetical protein
MQLIKSNVTEIRLIYTVVILLGDNFHVVPIVEAYIVILQIIIFFTIYYNYSFSASFHFFLIVQLYKQWRHTHPISQIIHSLFINSIELPLSFEEVVNFCYILYIYTQITRLIYYFL